MMNTQDYYEYMYANTDSGHNGPVSIIAEPSSLANALKYLRMMLGISVDDAAELAGYAKKYTLYTHERSADIKRKIAIRIAGAYGYRLDVYMYKRDASAPLVVPAIGVIDWLRRLRISKGVSQTHIAKAMYVSDGTYSFIENGHVDVSVERLALMCLLISEYTPYFALVKADHMKAVAAGARMEDSRKWG